MTGWRSRNPYIGALWLVGIGSIVLGSAAYWWMNWLSFGGSLNYPSNGIFVPWAIFAQIVGPGIVLVGLGTLVALQFLLRSLRARDNAAATRASSR